MDRGTLGVIGPEDGQRIVNPIGGAMALKLSDAMTNGAFSIHDNILPPRSPGPRLHRHRLHDEFFYVLSGTLTVEIEHTLHEAKAGSFVVIPRGAAHRPSNPSEGPVHVLLLFSPGGMDTFFLEAANRHLPLQAVPADPAVAADLEAFTARYGFEFADDPPR